MIRKLTTAVALLLTAAASQPRSQSPSADTILINGVVLTVDPKDSVAEALAIANGKILAVGTTANIRKLAGANTQVIDLADLLKQSLARKGGAKPADRKAATTRAKPALRVVPASRAAAKTTAKRKRA